MSLITPDSGLIIWMTLIFGIVFFLLAKFGFPAITSSVQARADRINESIRAAKEAEERLSTLAQEEQRMIEDARKQQAEILMEAAKSRDAILADARAKAQDETSKMIEHAKVQIAAERESAIREIRGQVALISVNVAEKVLRKDLENPEAQLKLIDRLLDEVTSSEMN